MTKKRKLSAVILIRTKHSKRSSKRVHGVVGIDNRFIPSTQAIEQRLSWTRFEKADKILICFSFFSLIYSFRWFAVLGDYSRSGAVQVDDN